MKLTLALLLLPNALAFAGIESTTTINPGNHFAYGASFGWIDWRSDTTNGAVVSEYVCSGYLYAGNIGWIHLGNGHPANGIRYQQATSDDYGVNHDGLGNLRGYAWGANIGWIRFEDSGAPKIDLTSGRFSGYAYSANLGWISLSNAVVFVQTDTIVPGTDSDSNGLADAWELEHFAHLGVNPSDDPDHDGLSNLQEYLAGTDPVQSEDNLHVTISGASPPCLTISWSSHPGHQYRILENDDLSKPDSWSDAGLELIVPDQGSSTSRSLITSGSGAKFYRLEVTRPLSK